VQVRGKFGYFSTSAKFTGFGRLKNAINRTKYGSFGYPKLEIHTLLANINAEIVCEKKRRNAKSMRGKLHDFDRQQNGGNSAPENRFVKNPNVLKLLKKILFFDPTYGTAGQIDRQNRGASSMR